MRPRLRICQAGTETQDIAIRPPGNRGAQRGCAECRTCIPGSTSSGGSLRWLEDPCTDSVSAVPIPCPAAGRGLQFHPSSGPGPFQASPGRRRVVVLVRRGPPPYTFTYTFTIPRVPLRRRPSRAAVHSHSDSGSGDSGMADYTVAQLLETGDSLAVADRVLICAEPGNCAIASRPCSARSGKAAGRGREVPRAPAAGHELRRPRRELVGYGAAEAEQAGALVLAEIDALDAEGRRPWRRWWPSSWRT